MRKCNNCVYHSPDDYCVVIDEYRKDDDYCWRWYGYVGREEK